MGHKEFKHIVILGAGSDMALALLPLLFTRWSNCTFYLLARNLNTLEDVAQQGRVKGHLLEVFAYDLLKPVPLPFSNIECCLVFAGWLPPDNTEPEKTMLVNCTAIQLFTDELIESNIASLKQIVITGSVAGVRVRASNKAYGQAKAALHQYTRGLQKKWAGKMYITLVIPGFVNTKMIEGRSVPAVLTITPQQIAKKYTKWLAMHPLTAYSQPAWQLISFILKLLPAFIIRKM